jgi:hypothetical protein
VTASCSKNTGLKQRTEQCRTSNYPYLAALPLNLRLQLLWPGLFVYLLTKSQGLKLQRFTIPAQVVKQGHEDAANAVRLLSTQRRLTSTWLGGITRCLVKCGVVPVAGGTNHKAILLRSGTFSS